METLVRRLLEWSREGREDGDLNLMEGSRGRGNWLEPRSSGGRSIGPWRFLMKGFLMKASAGEALPSKMGGGSLLNGVGLGYMGGTLHGVRNVLAMSPVGPQHFKGLGQDFSTPTYCRILAASLVPSTRC